MNKDLSSMTRSELETLKRQVEKAMVDVAEKDRKAALAAAEKAAADHGFSLAEITGMARQPAWFKDALSNGTSPEAMEI